MTSAHAPLRLITPDAVRASVKRAKQSLEKAAEEIVWQVEMQAWRTLGYSSWNAMREAEYGEAAFMVPRKDRPELVGRMRRAGLTQQEIAATAGVTERTVRSDLSTGNVSGSEPGHSDAPFITNSRGQVRPTSYARAEAEASDDAEFCRGCGSALAQCTCLSPDATTASMPVEAAVITATCPTCHGTGKVTQ
jgi:hypothetical protein